MALNITQLERFTDQQNTTLSNVIDKVNDEASRNDRSIPRMIDTAGTPSTSDLLALPTAQVLIVLLTASLADAEKRQHVLCSNHRGPGRFVDVQGRDPGRDPGQGPTQGVLGPVNEAVDRQLT